MSKGKILVVEDDLIVARDLQERLVDMGYEVPRTARTGGDAIEAASRLRPDLVLMDIRLKGPIDGVEAAREIREQLDIPVVYVTAYADEKTLGRAKVSEPFAYIVKPFEESALHTNIQVALFKHAMEKRLKDSEKWLSTTLLCIGDPTIVTDEEGRIKFMNPAAESTCGWSREDALGRVWSDVLEILDPCTRGALDVFAMTAERKDIVRLEHDIVLIDGTGTEIAIAMTAAPIIDESWQTRGLVLVLRDVSEREVVKEALEQSHNLLQAVLDGTSDIIFLRNLEGRFTMMNVAGLRLLGRSPAEVIGCSDTELFGPATAALMTTAHERALASGRTQTFECSITRDGAERTYLVSQEVCCSKEGSPVGVIAIGRDITDLKLGHRPLFRQDELTRTGRAVGRLAHEMQHSIAGIREALPTIRDRAMADPASSQHATEIEEELARISHIAQQMSKLYWKSRSSTPES